MNVRVDVCTFEGRPPMSQIQYLELVRAADAGEQSARERLFAALYDELRGRHQFTLPVDRIRAAVNDSFVDAAAPLRDGDRVVFIPPVAGG